MTHGLASSLRNQNPVVTVSTLLNGQYGIDEVCLSLSDVVRGSGPVQILQTSLAPDEKRAIDQSTEPLKAREQSSRRWLAWAELGDSPELAIRTGKPRDAVMKRGKDLPIDVCESSLLSPFRELTELPPYALDAPSRRSLVPTPHQGPEPLA